MQSTENEEHTSRAGLTDAQSLASRYPTLGTTCSYIDFGHRLVVHMNPQTGTLIRRMVRRIHPEDRPRVGPVRQMFLQIRFLGQRPEAS
ncbi:MAG: hypothetical protein JWO71_736 [Candidatus Acidoferrum typicum]|nr:hypothetical protein [Candidatus Acidoferrum typicum]